MGIQQRKGLPAWALVLIIVGAILLLPLIVLGAIAVFGVAFYVTGDDGSSDDVALPPPAIVEPAPAEPATPIAYQEIASLQTRFDGAITYYVLIDPVDLSSAAFKDDVKSILRVMVKEHGSKLSVAIFDDRVTLDENYRYNSDTARLRTEEEDARLMRHKVAHYAGLLSTAGGMHELMFFPAAVTGTPEVGPYVDAGEYDPSK